MSTHLSKAKKYIGNVSKKSNDKMIVVSVDFKKKDLKYNRYVVYTRKFHVHDEESAAVLGARVLISEVRPLSKTKFFQLVEILSD